MSSLRNLKLTIEYRGTNYHGWQIQPNVPTVQGVLQNTLAKIVNHPVKLIGACRTDAGVHAYAQVANFKTNNLLESHRLKQAVNSLLPEDIIVKHIEEVDETFNARFCASSRWYRYLILNTSLPNCFDYYYTYWFPYPLNTEKMQQAAEYLIGTHDFSAFSGSQSTARNPICTVKEIKVIKINCKENFLFPCKIWSEDLIIIDIKANHFLHQMVRIITGTLIEIGRGKRAVESIEEILEKRQRKFAGFTAPAYGLILMGIEFK